jgi:hypothetical protein
MQTRRLAYQAHWLSIMLSRTLQLKREAIAQRWLYSVYDSYAPETAKFLKKKKDPFDNPVGARMVASTAGICEQICADELDAEAVCGHLIEIIKVRAVQDMSPSKAMSFVFSLKDAARQELGQEADAALLTEIDRRVDQIALFAFDIYVKCREQMYQLRVNEVKRKVKTIINKFNKENCGVDPEDEPGEDAPLTSTQRGVEL